MSLISDFEKICEIARKFNISQFSYGNNGFSAKLEKLPQDTPTIINKDGQIIPVEGMPTEDELLLWSADTPSEQKGE